MIYNLINSDEAEPSGIGINANRPIDDYALGFTKMNPSKGTTGGIISLDEDEEEFMEDEEGEDEDDDMIEEEKKLLEDIKISPNDIVIVASFKLPINIEKVKDNYGNSSYKIKPSKSMLYPTMFNLREKRFMPYIQWIGWPGIFPENEKEEKEIIEFLKSYGCIPIFFDSTTIEEFLYYHETVLRPLFHNFKGLNDFEYDLGKQELWQTYQTVNAKFASLI